MSGIGLVGTALLLGAQVTLGPWRLAPDTIDLRDGKRLKDEGGVSVSVFRSPESRAFLLLEGRSGLDDDAEQDQTLRMYDSSGRERWRRRLKGMSISECRLAEEGRFVHLGASTYDEHGYLTSVILSLDAEGREISRLANVRTPGTMLYWLSRSSTALYSGIFEDHPGDVNRWSVAYVDVESGRTWRRSFDGGKGAKKPGSVLTAAASGSHVVFGWGDTVYSVSAAGKELWRRTTGKDFQGWFSLSDDGARLIRGSGPLPLACDDNLTGRPLWQADAPGRWAHGFVEATHAVFWFGWEPKELPPVQATAMDVVVYDEDGRERDRFLCPVPKEAVNHRVSLGVRAGRIEVRLDDRPLMSRAAAWLAGNLPPGGPASGRSDAQSTVGKLDASAASPSPSSPSSPDPL